MPPHHCSEQTASLAHRPTPAPQRQQHAWVTKTVRATSAPSIRGRCRGWRRDLVGATSISLRRHYALGIGDPAFCGCHPVLSGGGPIDGHWQLSNAPVAEARQTSAPLLGSAPPRTGAANRGRSRTHTRGTHPAKARGCGGSCADQLRAKPSVRGAHVSILGRGVLVSPPTRSAGRSDAPFTSPRHGQPFGDPAASPSATPDHDAARFRCAGMGTSMPRYPHFALLGPWIAVVRPRSSLPPGPPSGSQVRRPETMPGDPSPWTSSFQRTPLPDALSLSPGAELP